MKKNHITDITENDIRIIKAIKQITSKGNNAEVRQKRDGSLTVYEVKKHIAVG